MPCRSLQYGDGLISGVTDFIDCQAQNLGLQGYAALSTPGSWMSALLGVLLSIYIGFHGYRMVLGHTPGARETVLAVVKIGVMLMLATSWPAYRTLIYETAMRGPAELASSIVRPAGLPEVQTGLAARLQLVDDNLVVLSHGGMFGNAVQSAAPAQAAAMPPTAGQSLPRLAAPSVYDPSAFDTARLVFLCSVIGALALPRLIAGILLGLGPFFIAFLLFDTSKRITEGWMRALVGAALGGLGTSVVLSVELALVEPWISDLLARRAAQLTRVGSPLEMLAIASVFAFMLAATLFASARIAGSLRLPDSAHLLHALEAKAAGESMLEREAAPSMRDARTSDRSRAAMIAEAASNSHRRSEALAANNVLQRVTVSPQAQARASERPAIAPLGQAGVRRTRQRTSELARRRDRTA